MPTTLLIDNSALSRFEMTENNATVFGEYTRGPNRVILTHVEADPRLRGTGAAERFMEKLVANLRDRKLKLEPRCDYAADWLDKHPEHRDMVVDSQMPADGTDGDAFRPPSEI